ncbi:MAG: hypothetical protein QOF60_1157 [Actinomycetota bacterium]|nr:hypothetical protein [Actinomycetota bacterium]
MTASETTDLVALGDIDELVRYTDRLTDAERWDDLVELRDLSRLALERGRQLWPVAARAEYRLALDAPGQWAAKVLVSGTGRFALGPLPEVAASTHTWDDLADHVIPGIPEAAIAAHERVVRGDDLRGDRRLDPFVLEVPLALCPWEPSYPVAEYLADEARFPLPEFGGFHYVASEIRARPAEDADAVRALVELATAWTADSNGHCEAVAVHGDAAAALDLLGLGPDGARMAEITPAAAMAWMAWTAASGGAHGRRRGMAAGRFAAWWAAAALTGMLEDYPPDPSELGDAISELRWWAWDPGGPEPGWACRLAIEDPADGLAWALNATDAALP